MGKGYLQIELRTGDMLPVKNAKVLIKDANGSVIYELITDESGLTGKAALEAPAADESYGHSAHFAIYDVEVPYVYNYKMEIIHGVQIFDNISSSLPIRMLPKITGEPPESNIDEIFIPKEHGVDYQRAEQSVQGNVDVMQTISANDIKIPEYITVHLGSPNSNAQNVRVSFVDYIKNVASSEIFPTWPTAALYANIYAQISFALNRTYTVWYRSRGFDFDITNSTAFDQYFVYGRNIFDNISLIVDNIFNMFLRRQGRREPFFAQYCNGTTSTCNGMSQWGSYDLANKGYDPLQILLYYYPSDVQIVESNSFTSAVGSYGGVVLREGSSGEDVRTMQDYLNRIRTDYPLIPQITNPNGFYGASTTEAVKVFQQVFNLIPDGYIGKSTWYKISTIYVGVKRLAELDSEGERLSIGKTPPTVTIQMGSRGEYVVELQFLLNFIGSFFPAVPFVIEDAKFGDSTKRAVTEFQKNFGLTPDGIVGPATWKKLYDVYNSIEDSVVIPPSPPGDVIFPGVALRLGSRSEDVRLMQQYLNAISKVYTSIPSVTADGIFGQNTQAAVIAFQRQFGLSADGVIGRQTWDKIVSVYNGLPGTGTPTYPGTPLRLGSRGESVRVMQSFLRDISAVFPVVPTISADGVFGTNTQSAVIAFQRFFGLTPDGVIGQQTWNKIVSVHETMPNVAAPKYPGTALRLGSSGNDVIIMQKYLAAIAGVYQSIPMVTADGVFGATTQSAVYAFQRQFGLTADGVIGQQTWNMIVSVFNSLNTSAQSIMSVNAAGYSRNQSSGINPMALLMALKMGRMF